MEIQTTKTGGVLSWGEKDWLAGLLPYFENVATSINSNGLDGLTWTKGIDPYYMPGSLWPGRAFTAQTNNSVIDAMQKNAITNGDQSYSVGGAKIHNFSNLTGTITNGATFPHTVTHGGDTGIALEDIAIYYIGSTKYAFYSYNDSAHGNIGRYDLATTFVDDWLSNPVPASGAALTSKISPHPLIVGDDDCLYVGDGNVLSKVDGQAGAAGTYYPSKLTLPIGSIITSFSKIANYLVIYAYKPSTSSSVFYRSDVRAYFWDYVSEDPTYSYPIQGNYINGGFTFKGQPGCFVQGVDPSFKSQRGGKLILFNGSQFEEVCSFPESIPGHGGVETVANVIRWNSDGVIYQYGSLFGYPNALNRLLISSGGTSSGGMLRNLALNHLFISTGTTTGGGLESTLNGGWYTGAQVYVGLSMPPFPLGYKGRVTSVKILWRNKYADSGSKAALNLIYRNTSTSGGAVLAMDNSVITPTSHLAEEYKYAVASDTTSNIIFPSFTHIGWQLTYTAGTATDTPDVIQRIEIHYENTKV